LQGAQSMNFKSLYIWFGIPVLLIAVWVAFVYIPADSAMKKKESQLSVIKNERQKLDGNLKDLTIEARAQENLQQSYNDFMRQAPVIEKIPEYMRSVMQMAKSKGVAIGSLHGYYNSIDVSQKTGLVYPIFEIGLKGGFLEMGRFLEELSGKTGFKGVQKAYISYEEKEYPALNGKFVIEFKALKGKKRESQ
jgi:Tfp pilus assembly protein PilO